MIFTHPDQIFRYLRTSYEKRQKVDISSYGMYLGITIKHGDLNHVYRTEARDFIDLVDKKKLRIVIGVSYFIECILNCKDCRERYNNILKRHLYTKQLLGIHIRFSSKSYMKYYRVGDVVVTGGINLGNSNFTDCASLANSEDKKLLAAEFEHLWVNSKEDIKPYLK